MNGRVYLIQGDGSYGDKERRPHVVVVELPGGKECLVVPAFGADGFKVNEFVERFKRQSTVVNEKAIYVELDNTSHVTFKRNYPGKPAKWVAANSFQLSLTELNRAEHVGDLTDEGFDLVLEMMMMYVAALQNIVAPKVYKAIKQLYESRKQDSKLPPWSD